MIRPLLLLSLCAGLAGCGIFNGFSGLGSASGQNAQSERELPFDATLRENDAPGEFRVSVESGGAGVDAVRESVRFEGTKFCIATQGSSDIAWDSTGDPENWSFTQDGATLVFSGRCVGR